MNNKNWIVLVIRNLFVAIDARRNVQKYVNVLKLLNVVAVNNSSIATYKVCMNVMMINLFESN